MIIKYRETETITFEKIIIALMYNLYKENRPIIFTDEELKSATDIEMLGNHLDSFIGNITYNLSANDLEKFMTNCKYLTYNNGEYRLKETISIDYIDYLAHTLDLDLLCMLKETTYDILNKKYIETIYYKNQVLGALYALNKDYGIRKLTSQELRHYRIVLAQYLASRNERIVLEASRESIEKFQKKYSDEIETVYNGDELTYVLRTNVTLSELESLTLNNLSNYELELLTSSQIIEESFDEPKKLKLK